MLSVQRGPQCAVGCRVMLSAYLWDGVTGTGRSPGLTVVQEDLGRLKGDTFVLWTGLDVVSAVAILPALPLPLVPRDLKPTVSHTNFSLCAELH